MKGGHSCIVLSLGCSFGSPHIVEIKACLFDKSFYSGGVGVGFMGLSGLGGMTEDVIGKVLGFIVVLAILGGTIALVFTNLNTLVDAFEGFTSNSTVLAALVPIFGLVLGVLIVLGIVKIIQRFTGA